MNIKDILSDKTKQSPLLLNSDVYSGIYKKTEKVACAVFLITDTESEEKNDDLVNDIRRLAKDALLEAASLIASNDSNAMATLISRSVGVLMGLRSLLYVLAAARGVRTELVDVISREIDGVVRTLFSLAQTEGRNALFESIEQEPRYALLDQKRTGQRPQQVVRGAVELSRVPQEQSGRRDAILSILRARGTVSIKDISDSITDVSEKTIQRELMSLIEEGLIVREGERRWSKYSLISK